MSLDKKNMQAHEHINSIILAQVKNTTHLIKNATSRAKQSLTRNCRLPVCLQVMGEKSEID